MATSTPETRTPIRPTALSEDQIRTYQEEGYLVLRGLMSPADAEAMKAEVLDIMDKIGLGMSKLRQSGEYLEGSTLDSLVNSPNLKNVAEQLLGGPGTIFLPFTAVKSGGGGGRFHFHQDNQYTRFDGPGINLWFALDTMTPENGCLQVIPRSHMNGTLESNLSGDGDAHRKITWEPEDFKSILMEPGDCIAFTRLTIHGSGPNTTDRPRVAYAVQYFRDDVRIPVDGNQALLKDFPRYQTGPVREITVPKDKLEGH
jgi:2-oxoglutarate-dependent dioxygenase